MKLPNNISYKIKEISFNPMSGWRTRVLAVLVLDELEYYKLKEWIYFWEITTKYNDWKKSHIICKISEVYDEDLLPTILGLLKTSAWSNEVWSQ